MIHAYAVQKPEGKLESFEFDPGPLGAEQVEIDVKYCGVCHSDLSMRDNHFGMTEYPFVPGHEVVGTVAALGDQTKGLEVGQKVGLGWYSESCMQCEQCMSGNHNLCRSNEGTIIGRHGGFADRVRCHWAWATPLPGSLAVEDAGPLFCGGITVFNPIVQFGVKPTDKVGVVGIGGLGHLALQFLNKWGCEVTAFTSSDSKVEEAKKMGAHKTVNSRSADDIKAVDGSLDFIISTVTAPLEWDAYLAALAPKGRLHFVGVVSEPIPTPVFPLLASQLSLSASPLGSPQTTAKMLEFCARHSIAPVTEHYKMSEANEAFEHLEAGKARYRIVLEQGA